MRPVEVLDLGELCVGRLGFDPRRGVSTRDWLTTPTQRLAEMTAGAVFRDDTGELTAVREALRWYPDDVWRFVLAGQWMRIGQEEAFVGRSGEVGGELGSASGQAYEAAAARHNFATALRFVITDVALLAFC